MKRTVIILCSILLTSFIVTTSHTAPMNEKSMKAQFGNPGKPGLLRIISGQGNITITGYNGKEVVIDVLSSEELDNTDKTDEVDEVDEKAKGMKRIAGSGMNVSTLQDTIVVTRSMNKKVDLKISVPYKTSLQIGTRQQGLTPAGFAPGLGTFIAQSVAAAFNISGGIFAGDITVSNVEGEIEAGTMNGNITLNNISGSVIANGMDGEILVTFKNLKDKTPMAFSTMDGDIDVSFPSNMKATITAKNMEGDIYTDFDIDILPNAPQAANQVNKNDTIGILGLIGIGETVAGTINGGGMEVFMTTMEGNIYIRKSK